jgi:hypothetical protein
MLDLVRIFKTLEGILKKVSHRFFLSIVLPKSTA